MNNIAGYLVQLKEALSRSTIDNDQGGYLDLAKRDAIQPEELKSTAAPVEGLAGYQEIIMEQIASCNIDKIKIGINELLKHLLSVITPEREHHLAQQYFIRLKMIFKRCLLSDFPFSEDVWNYICNCLRTTGTFLMDEGYFTAAREVIDFLAAMGRIAALKGLPTANTQSSLRILENKAMEQGQKPLASTAKNARFNLET